MLAPGQRTDCTGARRETGVPIRWYRRWWTGPGCSGGSSEKRSGSGCILKME